MNDSALSSMRLQFLHSVGLLRASYRPDQAVCAIRSLLRHRESLVQMAATHVNHMQKALAQMNLQLHHVISDITGLTGLAIVTLSSPVKGIRPRWPGFAMSASRQVKR